MSVPHIIPAPVAFITMATGICCICACVQRQIGGSHMSEYHREITNNVELIYGPRRLFGVLCVEKTRLGLIRYKI